MPRLKPEWRGTLGCNGPIAASDDKGLCAAFRVLPEREARPDLGHREVRPENCAHAFEDHRLLRSVANNNGDAEARGKDSNRPAWLFKLAEHGRGECSVGRAWPWANSGRTRTDNRSPNPAANNEDNRCPSKNSPLRGTPRCFRHGRVEGKEQPPDVHRHSTIIGSTSV
jgi:hypothetical protein